MTKDFVMFSSCAPRHFGRCYRVETVKCYSKRAIAGAYPIDNVNLWVGQRMKSQQSR
jgi:hypothetical protein